MGIEFDPARHAYLLDGISVPSVTTVLEPLNDFGAVPAETLRAAAEFGTHVHDACALLVEDRLDWDSLDLALVPYVIGAKLFLDESGLVPLAAEMRVGHKALRYCGTLDLLAEWKGARCLFDWKTGAVPRSTGPQLAGYALALATTVPPVKRRYAVCLQPHAYKVVQYGDPTDLSIFQSCLNLWHWSRKNAA